MYLQAKRNLRTLGLCSYWMGSKILHVNKEINRYWLITTTVGDISGNRICYCSLECHLFKTKHRYTQGNSMKVLQD